VPSLQFVLMPSVERASRIDRLIDQGSPARLRLSPAARCENARFDASTGLCCWTKPVGPSSNAALQGGAAGCSMRPRPHTRHARSLASGLPALTFGSTKCSADLLEADKCYQGRRTRATTDRRS